MANQAMALVTDRQIIVPASNKNRPGGTLRGGSPSWITVHTTGNRALGAGAYMHAIFLRNGGGTANVSFHAAVDRVESIQLLPWNEVAWHAGDGSGNGNYDSIGIETCVNGYPTMFVEQTLPRLAKLVFKLMTLFDIPLYRVVQHHDWSSYKKNCPTEMRANNQALWTNLLHMVGALSANKPLPLPVPNPRPVDVVPAGAVLFPETGYSINHGFKGLWFTEGYGLFVAGYPISEEYAYNGLIVQDMENGRMEWDPAHPEREPRFGASNRELVELRKSMGTYVGK